MAASTVDKVFEAIDGERDYQASRWGEDQGRHQHDVASFVVFMRQYHNQVVMRATKEEGWEGGLDEIRKIAALGVACMEQHGSARETIYSLIKDDLNEDSPFNPSFGREVILIGQHISEAEQSALCQGAMSPDSIDSIRKCVAVCVYCMANNGIVVRKEAKPAEVKPVDSPVLVGSANFLQVVPCVVCGSTGICFCGRCQGCGSKRTVPGEQAIAAARRRDEADGTAGPIPADIEDKAIGFEKKHGHVEFVKACGSALNRLLVSKGVVTEAELVDAMARELDAADAVLHCESSESPIRG